MSIDKKMLSERAICTKFINPALEAAGWDLMHQIREQHYFTDGGVIVRGKTIKRGDRQFADYLLSHEPGVPIGIIEAKDNNYSVGRGMQQGLGYATILDVPSVFSTNGDAFLMHDRLANDGPVVRGFGLDAFPSPEELWQRYCDAKKLSPAALPIVNQDYFSGGSGRLPRYY